MKDKHSGSNRMKSSFHAKTLKTSNAITAKSSDREMLHGCNELPSQMEDNEYHHCQSEDAKDSSIILPFNHHSPTKVYHLLREVTISPKYPKMDVKVKGKLGRRVSDERLVIEAGVGEERRT
ncbi:hypothetical protein E3N88_19287 [Mikania micrantha]|uniref:Uncharacterized protein n=1 Tax=Mikania micrantha TaxID=192012 RepID=A0A5N6NMS2_9ASTR|nr:hypothetical protein E3N88_19287 [Mikania micrantha]